MNYLFFLLLFSCSYLVPKQERKWIEKNKKFDPQTQLCNAQSYRQYLGADDKIISNTKELLKKIKSSGHLLSFADEVALYTLIQIDSRPDITSPNARFQFVFGEQKNKWIYRDHYLGPNTLFRGLEEILKRGKSIYGLKQILTMYDQFSPQKNKISSDFSKFLVNLHQKSPNDDVDFRAKYMRGDDLLTEGESMPSSSMKQLHLISNNLSVTKTNDEQSLITYIEGPNLTVKCNYDLTLYDYSIFLIAPKTIVANSFGINHGSNFFMATSSQDIEQKRLFSKSHIFEGIPSDRAIPFCYLKTPQTQFWMAATNERDPVQHLYRLVKSGVSNFKNFETMGTHIHNARHLFLTSPLRVAFEFQRSDEKKIDEINQLDIPVYQADRLGMVHTFGEFQGQFSFILDDRYPEALSCSPQ